MSDHITVSLYGLEDIQARFRAMPRQIETARGRALRKTVAFVGAKAKAGLAAELGIKQITLKNRITRKVNTKVGYGIVWFGLNPIPAHLLGKPRQDGSGINVGDRRYPGAFAARIYSADQRVWIRFRSKHYDPALYPGQPRQTELPANLRHRFPVMLAQIPLDTPEVHRLIDLQATAAGQRMREAFEHEINYAVNVEK